MLEMAPGMIMQPDVFELGQLSQFSSVSYGKFTAHKDAAWNLLLHDIFTDSPVKKGRCLTLTAIERQRHNLFSGGQSGDNLTCGCSEKNSHQNDEYSADKEMSHCQCSSERTL